MSAIESAADALRAALRTVPKLKVYEDLGAVVDPPAAVVGPPELTPEAFGPEFTDAVFVIGVVVPDDERAIPRLLALVPLVAAAIYDVDGAVVRRASPGTWPGGGGVDLPAYLFETEMSL